MRGVLTAYEYIPAEEKNIKQKYTYMSNQSSRLLFSIWWIVVSILTLATVGHYLDPGVFRDHVLKTLVALEAAILICAMWPTVLVARPSQISVKQEEREKKLKTIKKRKRMPRIFRIFLYFLLCVLAYRFVMHIDQLGLFLLKLSGVSL